MIRNNLILLNHSLTLQIHKITYDQYQTNKPYQVVEVSGSRRIESDAFARRFICEDLLEIPKLRNFNHLFGILIPASVRLSWRLSLHLLSYISICMQYIDIFNLYLIYLMWCIFLYANAEYRLSLLVFSFFPVRWVVLARNYLIICI